MNNVKSEGYIKNKRGNKAGNNETNPQYKTQSINELTQVRCVNQM